MSSTSVWISCPSGTEFFIYDPITSSGQNTGSIFLPADQYGYGYCAETVGSTPVVGMAMQFNAIAFKTEEPETALTDGLTTGWAVVVAMVAAYSIHLLRRSLT